MFIITYVMSSAMPGFIMLDIYSEVQNMSYNKYNGTFIYGKYRASM